MDAADFNFPRGAIAPAPARPRENVRLLVADRESGRLRHRQFTDIYNYIAGDPIWANNSKSAATEDRQPVYASRPGSHAAPSAGLPFTVGMVEALQIRYLTLHISSPRGQEDIRAGYRTGKGWLERYEIPNPPATRVTAIGTTVVKALETWARNGQQTGWSNLFIQPPFEFLVVDKLLTNFHWPGEPLLALTAAFGGYELIKEVYEVAVREKYLFGDFGDRLLVI